MLPGQFRSWLAYQWCGAMYELKKIWTKNIVHTCPDFLSRVHSTWRYAIVRRAGGQMVLLEKKNISPKYKCTAHKEGTKLDNKSSL